MNPIHQTLYDYTLQLTGDPIMALVITDEAIETGMRVQFSTGDPDSGARVMITTARAKSYEWLRERELLQKTT